MFYHRRVHPPSCFTTATPPAKKIQSGAVSVLGRHRNRRHPERQRVQRGERRPCRLQLRRPNTYRAARQYRARVGWGRKQKEEDFGEEKVDEEISLVQQRERAL